MNTTIAISLLDRATHHIIGRNDPENEFGDPGRINSKFSRPMELNNIIESRDPSWALYMWPDLQERGLIRAPLQNTDFTTILWIHHQTIHVCMFCGQQFTSLLFLRLLSEPCQTAMNARFVSTQSSLLAVQQRLPGCEVSHDLVVILSTDLTTFWANSSTSGSIKQV